MLTQSPEEDKQNHTQAQGITHIQKLLISHLGLSIVNQQARELCYISFQNLSVRKESSTKHLKLNVKVGDLQIDNQLSRETTAIILKREKHSIGAK